MALSIAHILVSGFDVAQLNVTQEEFYSTKITNKVLQQIQDPLVLASNATPDWCEQLTMWCPMLFPFETRQLYFTCTAFGASRWVAVVRRAHAELLPFQTRIKWLINVSYNHMSSPCTCTLSV